MLQHHPSNIRIRHVERRCANWIRLQELFSHRKSPVSACGNACESCTEWVHTCQLSRFSQEFPSFLLNLPVSQNAFWVIFGDYSWTLSLITFPHMQRFLGVSRFLYSGGWQVCEWNVTISTSLTADLVFAGKFSKYLYMFLGLLLLH